MAFPSNCEGRSVVVSASSGCTLTRATIRGMTPQDFEDQAYKEVGMDRIYNQAKEAKMAGYQEKMLMTLLMSKMTPIKDSLSKSKISPSESIILPYITRRQKRHINSNYWKVTTGTPTTGAGSGSVPASAFDLTIVNNPSAYATTLTELDRYFLPGKMIFVEYANSTTSVAYSLQYKILAASTVSSVTKVTVEPNYSAVGWAALSAASKLPYQIGGVSGGSAVAGTIAYLGANSVSDYESWGGQDVAENPNAFINFFLQTSRIAHEYTDEYLRALNSALTSNYFKNFLQMPLAEQRKIQQAKYERDWMNSAFYGQRINEYQTVEGYRSLPQVTDPANPTCALEYKSNALGFKTLLSDCSRVTDRQGNKLDLDAIAATGYQIMRAREAAGANMDDPTIDYMTDRFTAGRIHDIMTSYYKAKNGTVTSRDYSGDVPITFENQVLLKYNKYQLPPELGGFTMGVFTDRFFDDKLSAAADANRARTLWCLDWSDFELGIAGSNSAVRQTNMADALYNYVIKANIKHVQLNSTTWTPIIEDPNRHAIVENFSTECPSLTVSGCTV